MNWAETTRHHEPLGASLLLNRRQLFAILFGDAILYGLVAYEAAVVLIGFLAGMPSGSRIVDTARVIGIIGALSVVVARTWIRRKVLIGSAVAAILLIVAITVVLYSSTLPRPLVIGLIGFYGLAAVAFVTRPVEI